LGSWCRGATFAQVLHDACTRTLRRNHANTQVALCELLELMFGIP